MGTRQGGEEWTLDTVSLTPVSLTLAKNVHHDTITSSQRGTNLPIFANSQVLHDAPRRLDKLKPTQHGTRNRWQQSTLELSSTLQRFSQNVTKPAP